jgi:hypothetical protein
MARIKKYADNLDVHLTNYQTFLNDTNPNSDYFRISEFKDTFTGGINGFLIEGSEYLKETTELKIEILDVQGNPIYFEPGMGIPQYYEGTSKVIAVYVYEDTPIGLGKITILGELKKYRDAGVTKDIPTEWANVYNVKWEKSFKINRLLRNEEKVRFYKRPKIAITEVVKPLYSTTTNTVTKKGFVNGTAILPALGQSLTSYTLPTTYNLTTTDGSTWTGSMVGTTLELTDLGYNPVVSEIINNTQLLVKNPYTDVNGNVANFTNQRYTASFNYIEGAFSVKSALTGSFAQIDISDLATFTGDVARVKVYRKSQSQLGDYQFVQEIPLEANELLRNFGSDTQNALLDYYGQFTQPILTQYWVTSSNNITTTFNQDFLFDSVKLDSVGTNKFFTTQSLTFNTGTEYALEFDLRLFTNISPTNYIKAFISGSSLINGTNVAYQTNIVTYSSADNLTQKGTYTTNFAVPQQIQNAKLYFEVVGTGWYIANVSLTAAQETSFSPDAITFIEPVPRSLPFETFDYRFEFYDINNNYVPVLVNATKTFNGGNLQTITKSLKLNPSSLYFQFDSGSNPVAPTSIAFNLQKTLLTGSVHFTSQSIDFFGNVLSGSQYTASFDNVYPGLLNDITSSVPYLTVQHFTGSRPDINVQYVQITGECEGVTDTVIITRVLDGFGGVNYFIKAYNGTEIRNSSTQSLELQAYVVDGVNTINLKSNAIKGRAANQLHVLSGSKYITLTQASSSGFLVGITTGSLGTGELNYNAIFTRDTLKAQLNKQLAVYLMPTGSTSASILATTLLTDLQDGLGTGFLDYSTEHFTIQPRTQTIFTPVSASATASFYIRGANTQAASASILVYPSMSIDVDYVPHYYLYYATQSVDPRITITAIDDNKLTIDSGYPEYAYYIVDNESGELYDYTSTNESRHLNISFTYTEPYTTSSVVVAKTWQIVPEGKPGDDSIVFEVTPASVNLPSNAKGNVGTYTPADTSIKIKQGTLYLAFTGSQKPGTFWTASYNAISASNITPGNIDFTNTASFNMASMSNMTQLSGSITYDFEIHPYFTSSYYTQSVVQNYTKALAGAPPIQIIVTPANVTINSSESGVAKGYSGANTKIQLLEGTDYIIYTSSNLPGTYVTASVVGNHITPGKLYTSSVDSTSLFVSGFSSMNAPSASVQYNFVVYPYSLLPGHTTGSYTLSSTQNFTKVNDGKAARSLSISATSTTVNFDGDGSVVSPDGNIILTATAFNTTSSLLYYTFYKDGNVYSATSTTNTLEIGSGDSTSPGQTAVWKVTLKDGSSNSPDIASAEVTIMGVKSGGDVYNVLLSNENSSVVYKVSGQITFDGTGTAIKATKGANALTSVTSYDTANDVYDLNGLLIGNIGYYTTKIYAKSSHITLGGGLTPGSYVTGDPSQTVDITDWQYPTQYPTAFIIYEVDLENGRQKVYKTQSLAIQYEGNTGPGVVMRGEWSATTDYIGSVETTNYRRDAVIYGNNPVTYYASLSGSGPGTSTGAHAPSGTTSDTAYWQYLGTQDFFVAAKIAIFDESYVKNTINVGTKNGTSGFANIVIAGGRPDPYIAIGQNATVGTAGTSGLSAPATGIIGYNRPGIFLGIYEDGVAGTTGRFSIKTTSTSGKGMYWDGETLTIVGAIRQVAPGYVEPSIRGTWAAGVTYYYHDIVTYGGSSWTCTSNPSHVSTNTTDTSTGYPGQGPWETSGGTSGTSGPAGTSGTNGPPGSSGPGVVYRGNYDAGTAYFFTSGVRRDIVYYQPTDSYYITKANTTGNAPTNTSYWEGFGAQFSSVATDILLAKDATISRGLVLGTLFGYDGFFRSANASSITSGKGFYLTVDGKFRVGDTISSSNKYFYWDGTNISVNAGNFSLDTSGNMIANDASLSGTVSATRGNIGGWTINGSQLVGSGSAGQILLDPNIPAIKFNNSSGATKLTIRTGQLSYLSGGGIGFTVYDIAVPSITSGVGYSNNTIYGTTSTVYLASAGTFTGPIDATGFNAAAAGYVSADFQGDLEIQFGFDILDSGGNFISTVYLGSSSVYYYNAYTSGQFSSFGSNTNHSIYFPAGGTYTIRPYYNVYYNVTQGFFDFYGESTGNMAANLNPDLDFGELTENGLQVVSNANSYTKIERGSSYAMEAKGSLYITSPTGYFSYFNGVVHPYIGNTNDLGTTGNRWKTVWTDNALNSTSDNRFKNSIEDTDLGLDFINKLRPVKYKQNWSHSPRYHYGLIAQEITSSLSEFGKTTSDVGFIVSSSLKYTDEDIQKWKTQKDWSVWESEISASMNEQLGLSYTEFISPMIKAIQELSAKVEQLELIISGSKS